MKKTISSEMTRVYKFIFPTVWIGIFGLGTMSMMIGNDPVKELKQLAESKESQQSPPPLPSDSFAGHSESEG